MTIFGERCTAVVTSDDYGNVCIGTDKNDNGGAEFIWQWRFSPDEAEQIAKAIIESAAAARQVAEG